MKNLEEKLEIMQWLYEKGIEPEWSRYLTDEGTYGYQDVWFSNLQPWYPLEQVLELLPTYLNGEFFGQSSEAFWRLRPGGRFSYDFWLHNEVMDDCLTSEHSDYHLAALKLLKKVIEKYPESVNERKSN